MLDGAFKDEFGVELLKLPEVPGILLVQILTYCALDHLNDVFPVFGPSVQARMKTTSVCRTFHHLIFVIKEKCIILTHTIYCCLFLQI